MAYNAFLNATLSARVSGDPCGDHSATRGRSREFSLPDRGRPAHATHLRGALDASRAQRGQFPVLMGNEFYESNGPLP